MKELPKQSTPGKQDIVLHRDDLVAYSNLLIEAFPNVRFFDDITWLPHGERPPEKVYRSLAERREYVTCIFFDAADWRPEWSIIPGKNTNQCHLDNEPFPCGTLQMSPPGEGKAPIEGPPDVEAPRGGRIFFNFFVGEKEQERIVRKAIRLFEKIASNRRLMLVRVDTGEVLNPDFREGLWVGHHARGWYLARPNQFISIVPMDPERPIAIRPWPEDE